MRDYLKANFTALSTVPINLIQQSIATRYIALRIDLKQIVIARQIMIDTVQRREGQNLRGAPHHTIAADATLNVTTGHSDIGAIAATHIVTVQNLGD
jgi:hypothetical protein